jgi:hypothetical protein
MQVLMLVQAPELPEHIVQVITSWAFNLPLEETNTWRQWRRYTHALWRSLAAGQ